MFSEKEKGLNDMTYEDVVKKVKKITRIGSEKVNLSHVRYGLIVIR
jgi:hypothetical protein